MSAGELPILGHQSFKLGIAGRLFLREPVSDLLDARRFRRLLRGKLVSSLPLDFLPFQLGLAHAFHFLALTLGASGFDPRGLASALAVALCLELSLARCDLLLLSLELGLPLLKLEPLGVAFLGLFGISLRLTDRELSEAFDFPGGAVGFLTLGF